MTAPRPPSPITQRPIPVVLLSHGGGGLRTKQLIAEVLLPALDNPILRTLDDGACLHMPESELVFTTDSYVVNPLFFPGGDIGRLAACGTINDMAMQAAEPRYITLSLILEEGLALDDLRRAVASFAEVTRACGVQVVAGDTKVVERGHGGGMYINTAGIGVRRHTADGRITNARPGDVVLINGPIGDHGIAVMAQREGIRFESDLRSDVAPLWDLVRSLLDAGIDVHALRDPTRGGLTGALCDIAEASQTGIRVRESAIPIRPAVRGACGLLGLDPLNAANEGKVIVICPEHEAERALTIMRQNALGRNSTMIGQVVTSPLTTAFLETSIGGERLLTIPAGEEMPRIC